MAGDDPLSREKWWRVNEMAITKLTRLKESAGKNKAKHLQHNIEYICNPKKCGGEDELEEMRESLPRSFMRQ